MKAGWAGVAGVLGVLVLCACSGGSGAGSATAGTAVASNAAGSSSSAASSVSASLTPQATAVGKLIGSPVTASIGASGGTLASSDGAISLSVPAGAFDRTVSLSIREITNEAHGAAGRAWRITPEGLHSAVPMTLTFRYSDDDLRDTSAGALSIAYQDDQQVWHVYNTPQRNAVTKTLSVSTTHFSDWSVITGARLLPMTGMLKVGESLNLRVRYCHYSFGEDGSMSRVVDCDQNASVNQSLHNWSATAGSVTPASDRTQGSAVYTAPASKPARNPVAVSVAYTPPLSSAQEILVSNIEISDSTVEDTACAWMRTAARLDAEAYFTEYGFNGSTPDETVKVRQSGHLHGTLVSRQQLPGWGMWTTDSVTGDAVLDDSLYTPGNGYTLTAKGNVLYPGPDAVNEHLSSIALYLDYTSCRYTLGYNVNVMATFHSDGYGPDETRPANVGQLRFTQVPMSSAQGAAQRIKAAIDVQARSDDSTSDAYLPGGLLDSSMKAAHADRMGWTTGVWTVRKAQ
ncbi:hypothetical protein VVD49_06060 [Uliginosibacterium sp. H3]|uniref:ZU5 domain-containing protein n=1 Tax=Uliginosibacterium silvisoli TaxID=3114758 RepID=A0ABU6K016_9RHOO|nr:hypothetical protein [Uliginosibacterium sp. H3]